MTTRLSVPVFKISQDSFVWWFPQETRYKENKPKYGSLAEILEGMLEFG